MQDLSKIEQEHLQANDVGDDAPDGLTRESAEHFATELRNRMLVAAAVYFEEYGMHGDIMNIDEVQKCIDLLKGHLEDAIGDMPIWEIVKRGEA